MISFAPRRLAPFARDPHALAVAVASLLAFAWYQWVTWTQFASLRFFLADIGVNDLVVSNTLAGRFMESPIGGWHYLAVHFKPILLALLPVYAVFDHPMTLATSYNLALAGAAIPLHLLARERLGAPAEPRPVAPPDEATAPVRAKTETNASPVASPVAAATASAALARHLALAFALAWLGNHFVLSMHLALHPEALAMPAFFCLFLAGSVRRPWLYWVSLVLILANKEDMPLYLFFYGLYVGFVAPEPNRRRGVATMLVSAAWLIFALAAMAILHPGAGETYKGGVSLLERYAHMGGSWGEIAFYGLTRPVGVLATLLSRPALWTLLAGLAFLPLLHWRGLWLLLPPAIIYLASSFEPQYDLRYYYSYPFLPFAFFLAVEGARRAVAWRRPLGLVAGLVLIASAAWGFAQPVRGENVRSRPFDVTDRHRTVRRLLRDRIGPEARVAAQYDLLCQIPRCERVVPLWLENLEAVDTVALDFRGRPLDLTRDEILALTREIEGGDWALLVHYDQFYLFQRDGAASDTTE